MRKKRKMICLVLLFLVLAVQIYFLIVLPLARLEYILFAVSGAIVGMAGNKRMEKFIVFLVLFLYFFASVLDPVLKIRLDRFFGVNTVGDFFYSFLLNGLTFSGFFVFYFISRTVKRLEMQNILKSLNLSISIVVNDRNKSLSFN